MNMTFSMRTFWRLAFIVLVHLPLTYLATYWVIDLFSPNPSFSLFMLSFWLALLGITAPGIFIYVPPATATVMSNTLLNLLGIRGSEEKGEERYPELWSATPGIHPRFWWDRVLASESTTVRDPIKGRIEKDIISKDGIMMVVEYSAPYRVVPEFVHRFYVAGEELAKQSLDEIIGGEFRPFIHGKTAEEAQESKDDIGEELDKKLEEVRGTEPDDHETWAEFLGIKFEGIAVPILRPSDEYINSREQVRKAELRKGAIELYTGMGVKPDKALGAVLADEDKAEFKVIDIHGLESAGPGGAFLAGQVLGGNQDRGGDKRHRRDKRKPGGAT